MILRLLVTLALPAVLAAHSGACELEQDSMEQRAGAGVVAQPVSLVQVGNAHIASRTTPSRGGVIDKVVFIKLHYVGSSTMNSILHHYCLFHEKNCFVEPEIRTGAGLTFGPKDLDKLVQHFQTPGVPGLDIWPNHVIMGSQLDALIPGNFKVCLFRSPLSRVMSGFRHSPGSAAFALARLQGHVLHHGALPTECVGQYSWAMADQITLGQVKELDFVMLTEQYDLSLMLLRRALGWSMLDMMYHRMKVSPPDRGADELESYLNRPAYELNWKTKEWLKRCTGGVEALIYEQAQEMFEHQLHRLSSEEQQQVHNETSLFASARSTLADCCKTHQNDAYCSVLSEDNDQWARRHWSMGNAHGTLQLGHEVAPTPANSACLSSVKAALASP